MSGGNEGRPGDPGPCLSQKRTLPLLSLQPAKVLWLADTLEDQLDVMTAVVPDFIEAVQGPSLLGAKAQGGVNYHVCDFTPSPLAEAQVGLAEDMGMPVPFQRSFGLVAARKDL